MSLLSIHIEACINGSDGKKRQIRNLVKGFTPLHTLQDVICTHDKTRKNHKEKIMQYWESRKVDDAFNKVWTVSS